MANLSEAPSPVVFLDTSIQIARTIREPRMKERIRKWVARYSVTVTSSVVWQEFKNRILTDVAYLLAKLNVTKSYMATLHYVANVLPARQQRKMRICMPVLHNLLPGADDAELTERAILYCRSLLVYGAAQFGGGVDSLVSGVECYWAVAPVREKKKYVSYDLGGKKCEKTGGLCRIGEGLRAKEDTCRGLLEFLDALPGTRLTDELRRAREFLRRLLVAEFRNVESENACLTVGDLLIALESEKVPEMYTMNYRESQAYCEFLQQRLSVRPNNPDRDEEEHTSANKPWSLP